MKIHPLCAKVPDMSDAEYTALVEDIAQNGFDPRFPIVVYEGQILDGRHRWKACQDLKITNPPTVPWAPRPNDTPEDFVVRASTRRSLTPAQRAALVADLLLPQEKEAAAARQKSGKHLTGGPSGRSGREAVAVAARKGNAGVEAVKVAAAASPETRKAMREGKVTVAEAKRTLPPKVKPRDPAAVAAESIREALGEAKSFRELVNEAHAFERKIKALAGRPVGHELSTRLKGIGADLQNVVNAIKHCVPYRQCPRMPNCLEKSNGCKLCKSQGWVCAGAWENIPKEDRR